MSAARQGEGLLRPPWNWHDLTPSERGSELEDLAAWVVELQEAYGHWVRLPPCWPQHRGLRDELAAYWYWRQQLDRSPAAAAEENVRWYQHLRSAAQAWAEAYAGCRHESLGEIDERRSDREAVRAATTPHLERLAQEWERC